MKGGGEVIKTIRHYTRHAIVALSGAMFASQM
jgi:hypothetical protein